MEEEDDLVTMGFYVFAFHERSPEEVRKVAVLLPEPIKFKFMSTLDIIYKRANERAERIKNEVNSEHIIKMHSKGLSLKEIADFLDLDEQFVLKTINSLDK